MGQMGTQMGSRWDHRTARYRHTSHNRETDSHPIEHMVETIGHLLCCPDQPHALQLPHIQPACSKLANRFIGTWQSSGQA